MDIASAVVALVIAGVFIVPAIVRPTAGRAVVALMFVGGGAFNLVYTLPRVPDSLEALVASAFVPAYRDAMHALVTWNAAGFALLVAACEITAGLLVLWRGPLVKLALLGAAIWAIGMLPVIPPDGLLIGIALTAAPGGAALLLLRRDYDVDVLSLARQPRLARAGSA